MISTLIKRGWNKGKKINLKNIEKMGQIAQNNTTETNANT